MNRHFEYTTCCIFLHLGMNYAFCKKGFYVTQTTKYREEDFLIMMRAPLNNHYLSLLLIYV